MTWQREVDGIEQRKRLAQEHGGADAVARQHTQGRLTIRERITGLVDADSFREQARSLDTQKLMNRGRFNRLLRQTTC